MPELIDKNALQKALREEYDRHKALYDEIGHIERGGIVQGLSYAKMILCKQPTIEAEPVRHGRWIPITNDDFGFASKFKCSYCNDIIRLSVAINECHYNYCPNCGARMDGGAENA